MKNEDIKFTTAESFYSIGRGLWLIKTGTSLVGTNGDQRNITGFALDEDKSLAILRARAELYERFWALYPYARGMDPYDRVPCYSIFSGKQCDLAASEILLDFGKNHGDTDSTGLAFGSTLNMALENGLREVIERHISANIWYSDAQLIFHSSKSIPELCGQIDTYTQITWNEIPYAVSFFYTQNQRLLTAGSSVSTTLDEAVKKAEFEALMVAICLFKNEKPISMQSFRREHYLTLNSEQSTSRLKYILSKVINKSDKSIHYISDIEQQARLVFGRQITQTFACILHKNPESYVVKVKNSFAERPKIIIAMPSIPSDPFV